MSLSDTEILELHELCCALGDERLSASQRLRLNHFLRCSEEARTYYFQSMALAASLTEYAGEMQLEAPALPARRGSRHAWTYGALAAAACVSLTLFLWGQHHPTPLPGLPSDELADSDLPSGEFVARITGVKNCVWRDAGNFQPGDAVPGGRRIDLVEGIAEITFDCGAQVKLEGPASLDVVSAWQATLERGDLKATVPPQAIGFRVHHKSVEVVDLGTEFSMVADAAGDAEVRVLKGAVEVSPLVDEDPTPTVLRETETRRFGKHRHVRHGDFELRHRRLAQTAKLERWKQPVNFAHWSFDEVTDGVFKADAGGIPGVLGAKPVNAPLTEGRWSKALHLDGQTALTATLPGISKPASRTVAFWVRVPQDAQLSQAQAMVSWPVRNNQWGSRVIEIGWNRNPNQGPLGALRTELGKIYAVGATPLRDGRWHHIAVLFAPVGVAGGPLQVTQYVDGQLEGTAVCSMKMKRPVLDNSASDVVWLGRPAGKHNKQKSPFRGDIDELFITDRALSEPEVVQLMTQNTLPHVELSDGSGPPAKDPASL